MPVALYDIMSALRRQHLCIRVVDIRGLDGGQISQGGMSITVNGRT